MRFVIRRKASTDDRYISPGAGNDGGGAAGRVGEDYTFSIKIIINQPQHIIASHHRVLEVRHLTLHLLNPPVFPPPVQQPVAHSQPIGHPHRQVPALPPQLPLVNHRQTLPNHPGQPQQQHRCYQNYQDLYEHEKSTITVFGDYCATDAG